MRSMIKRVLGTAAIATVAFAGAASTASASAGGPGGGGGYRWPYTYLSEQDCEAAGNVLTHPPYQWTSYSCAYDPGSDGHGPDYVLWLA